MESKIGLNERDNINIIITGCIHGCMDKMYKYIQDYEKKIK